VTRVGQPDDDINGAFKKAKDVALELISLYARIEPQDTEFEYAPPGKDDAPDLVVFSGTKALDFGALFRRKADTHFFEAKWSAITGFAQIP
jgi:protein SEY1